MTTVPGTYFTTEQLEADRKGKGCFLLLQSHSKRANELVNKADGVSAGIWTGGIRMNNIGFVYDVEKKQYEKALAWYILAAMENNMNSWHNIGALYANGDGVPKSHLCALKWFLRTAERGDDRNNANAIGELFENGLSVPVDKYKALEWYHRGGDKAQKNRLKAEGYHLSDEEKKKPRKQLVKETGAILDAEKNKLEEKQDKTQEEIEALVDLNIVYKLVEGGKDAWNDIPILFAGYTQRYTEPMSSSVTNNEEGILELKKQIQLLEQDRDTFESQTKQLQSLKQENANFELEIKKKDKELISLRDDKQSLQRKNSTVQLQIRTNDSKINSLQSENQELKLKIISFQTDNQSLKHRIGECEQQLKTKDNKINLLENEKHAYHSTSIQQTQTINGLEQGKMDTTNEMERLRASYATLEQLLKSKEDVIVSLNRENQMLSTTNQGNQQGANEMVDTLKSLLQAKTNETELVKQNMELLLENEKRRNDTLEEENRRLKQERNQQQATVQNTSPLNNNTNPTNGEPSQHDQHDDSYNDLNYESGYIDTEESDGDDINYDTPSEDEGDNNDLNYDDTN